MRFALVRHGRAIVIGSASLANTLAPTMSGAPRENESASLYVGEWTGSPNYYRFKIYRDGVLVNTVTQATEEYHFNWATADVGTAPSGTVEASADGGATYSSPVSMNLNFTFSSDLITPAAIADPTLTRTSTSGTLPVTFDTTATVFACYKWQIKVEDVTLTTLKYFGEKFVSETELISPFNMDLSGATDPMPSPAMPTLAVDDVVSLRLCSPDFVEGSLGLGVCSRWVAVSPTDRAGHRFWRWDVPDNGQGFVYMQEFEIALVASGANVASGRAYYSSQAQPWDPDNNSPTNLFDGTTAPGIINLPGYVTVDFGVNADVKEIRLTSQSAGHEPLNFTFSHADTLAGTYTASTLTPAGTSLTWAAPPVTKTFGVS